MYIIIFLLFKIWILAGNLFLWDKQQQKKTLNFISKKTGINEKYQESPDDYITSRKHRTKYWVEETI